MRENVSTPLSVRHQDLTTPFEVNLVVLAYARIIISINHSYNEKFNILVTWNNSISISLSHIAV